MLSTNLLSLLSLTLVTTNIAYGSEFYSKVSVSADGTNTCTHWNGSQIIKKYTPAEIEGYHKTIAMGILKPSPKGLSSACRPASPSPLEALPLIRTYNFVDFIKANKRMRYREQGLPLGLILPTGLAHDKVNQYQADRHL